MHTHSNTVLLNYLLYCNYRTFINIDMDVSIHVEELGTHVRTDGSILCTCVIACTLTELRIYFSCFSSFTSLLSLLLFSFLITFCSFLIFFSTSSPSLYFSLSSLPLFLAQFLLFLLLFHSFLIDFFF